MVPCMHMFDWGCEGDNIFPSIEECMATCQPGKNKHCDNSDFIHQSANVQTCHIYI